MELSSNQSNQNYEKENGKMENNFGVNDIITGRGLGVGGFGYGVGSYPGYGQFASPSANAVRLEKNADITNEQNKCNLLMLDQAEESRRFCDLNSNIFQSELRTNDRLRDIEREISANARAAAECCCETKLLIKDTTIDNLRSEAATANKDSILQAMNTQTNSLSCAINSLGQVVQNICAPRCCPTQG